MMDPMRKVVRDSVSKILVENGYQFGEVDREILMLTVYSALRKTDRTVPTVDDVAEALDDMGIDLQYLERFRIKDDHPSTPLDYSARSSLPQAEEDQAQESDDSSDIGNAVGFVDFPVKVERMMTPSNFNTNEKE